MSRILSVVALALVIGFAVSVSAAEKKEGQQQKAGTIKSVDRGEKTFVMDLSARPLTFTVDEKTVITLNGQTANFDAIKPKRQASVLYTRSGDERRAVRVEVHSGDTK